MTYISIPVEIEAIQFSLLTLNEIPVFTKCSSFSLNVKDGVYTLMITIDGIKFLVIENDYIIKSKDGKISIMKPDDFNSSYVKKE